MTLTKDALISAVAKANGYPRNQAVELVDIILELIKFRLAAGEDIMISGFGKFCVKEKLERRGRNPATVEDMMLRPRKVMRLRWSGKLRDKINQYFPVKVGLLASYQFFENVRYMASTSPFKRAYAGSGLWLGYALGKIETISVNHTQYAIDIIYN